MLTARIPGTGPDPGQSCSPRALQRRIRRVTRTRRRQNIVGHQMLHPGTRVNDPHRPWPLLFWDPVVRPTPPMPSSHSPCFHH